MLTKYFVSPKTTRYRIILFYEEGQMKKTRSSLQANEAKRSSKNALTSKLTSKRILLSSVAASLLASSAVAAPFFGTTTEGAIGYGQVQTAGNQGFFSVLQDGVATNGSGVINAGSLPGNVYITDYTDYSDISQQRFWSSLYGATSTYNNTIRGVVSSLLNSGTDVIFSSKRYGQLRVGDRNISALYANSTDNNITMVIDQTHKYAVTMGDPNTGVAYTRGVQIGAIGGNDDINTSTGRELRTVLNGTITLSSAPFAVDGSTSTTTTRASDIDASPADDRVALTIKGQNHNHANRSDLVFINQGRISISNDGNTSTGTFQDALGSYQVDAINRTGQLTALNMEINRTGNFGYGANRSLAGMAAGTVAQSPDANRTAVFRHIYENMQKGNITVQGGSYEARQLATYSDTDKFREANNSTGSVIGMNLEGGMEGDITVSDVSSIVATTQVRVSGFMEDMDPTDGNFSLSDKRYTTAEAGDAIGILATNVGGNIDISVGDVTAESIAISDNRNGHGEANVSSGDAFGIVASYQSAEFTVDTRGPSANAQGNFNAGTAVDFNRTYGNIDIKTSGNIIARSIARGGGGASYERNATTGQYDDYAKNTTRDRNGSYEYLLDLGDAVGIIATTVVDPLSTNDRYHQDRNATNSTAATNALYNGTGAYNADYNEFNRAADITITTAAGKTITVAGNNAAGILAQTSLGSINVFNNSAINVEGQAAMTLKQYTREGNFTNISSPVNYNSLDNNVTDKIILNGDLGGRDTTGTPQTNPNYGNPITNWEYLVTGINLKTAGGLVTLQNTGDIRVSALALKDFNQYRGDRNGTTTGEVIFQGAGGNPGIITNPDLDKYEARSIATGISIAAGDRHFIYNRFETSTYNGDGSGFNKYVNGSIFEMGKADLNESAGTVTNGDWLGLNRISGVSTSTGADGVITIIRATDDSSSGTSTQAYNLVQSAVNQTVANQKGHTIANYGNIDVDADIAAGIHVNLGEVIGISGIQTQVTNGVTSYVIKPKVLTSHLTNTGAITINGKYRGVGIDVDLSKGSAVLNNSGKIAVNLATDADARGAGILLNAQRHVSSGSTASYNPSDLAFADTSYDARGDGSGRTIVGYQGTDLVLNNSADIELSGAARNGLAGIWVGNLESSAVSDSPEHKVRGQKLVTINSTGIVRFPSLVSPTGAQMNALRVTSNSVAKLNQLGVQINETATVFNDKTREEQDKLIYVENGDLHLGHYASTPGAFDLQIGSTTSPAEYYISLTTGVADRTALANGVDPANYTQHQYVNDAVLTIDPGSNFEFGASYDVSNLIGLNENTTGSGDGASLAQNGSGTEKGRVYGALAGVRTVSELSMFEGFVYDTSTAVTPQNSDYRNQKFGVNINGAKSPGAIVGAQAVAALTAQGFKASNIIGSVLSSLSAGSVGYSNVAALSQGYFEAGNEYLASAGNVRTDASLEGLELYAANGSLAPIANTNGFVGFLVPYYSTTSIGGDSSSSGNMFGIVGGLSKEFADGSLVGVHLGIESGSYDADDEDISSDALSGLFGVHGRYNLGLFNSYVRGELNLYFSSYDYDFNFANTSSDNSNSIGYGVGLYYGADFALGGFGVLNPEIGLIYQGFSQDDVSVTGQNVAINNQQYSFDNPNDLFLQAAVRYSYAYELGGGSAVVPTVLLGVRQLLTDDKYSVTGQLGTGYAFDYDISRDSTTFITEIGVAYNFSETFSLSLNYNGDFGSDVTTHSGFLKVVGRF